jgi:SPP1 gp7 family putative phage head morphogenesis protein
MPSLTLKRRRLERAAEALTLYKQRMAGPSNADPGFWQSLRTATSSNAITNPFKQHPWVYRAVDVISATLLQAPFITVRGPLDDEVEVDTGPWADFFGKPSPWLSTSSFWQLTWIYQLVLPGDAFWVLFSDIGELVRNPNDIPRWAVVEGGDKFREMLDKESQILMGWEWSVGKNKVMLQPWQVVQFGKPNPDNQWRKQSPLQAGMRDVRSDHKAGVWNEALLDNGADPGVILKMPDLAPDQVKQVKRQWQDRHGGPAKQGKVAVLTGQNDDVIRTTLTHTEMGYKDLRQLSQEAIAAIYGVPMFVMGQLDDVRLETSKASMALFWETTLNTWLRMGQDTVDTNLLMPRGAGKNVSMAGSSESSVRGRFAVELVQALKADPEARRRLALADRDLGFSRNDTNSRHELGYDTDDSLGDVPLVRVGLERLEDVEAEPADPAEFGLPVPGGPPPDDEAEPAPEDSEDNDTPEADTESDDEERASHSHDDAKGKDPGRQGPPTDSTDHASSPTRGELARAQIWESYIREVHGPGEKRMRGRVRSVFNQIRARMLKFLKKQRAEMPPTSAEIEFFLAEELRKWESLIVDQTEPVYKGIMASSLDRLSQQIGGLAQASMESPAVAQTLLTRQQAIAGTTETIAKQMRFSMLEGINNQEGIRGLEKRIKDIMKVADNRAAAIARTETGAASTETRFAAYKEEGIKRHTWITARDDRVRETHLIDGETVEVGEDFSNGLRFPLDPSGDAEDVINCRCDTIPEIPDD